ncbi:nematode resistance protein-like HSPRO2 [Dioscorea cayenensis subsp. rotundata]|uniref:Nematode resistance protein-like HSPRO2 n=1 Tax=Dioscorea cayennensis subsp. rotundata TaxID=55577 RepID=A0AB40C2F0_DIOCR|nr:nematode resistance protein-like HSPRO2 [Dioscorea cayenensis subsp. rotundata]
MVDLPRKSRKMATPEISARSARLPSDKSHLSVPSSSPVEDASATAAYELYLRLPELASLWNAKAFPEWRNETILKPALQALEITFRFISMGLSDPRPYSNHGEWKRRLESLAMHEVELIALICEDEEEGGGSGAPIVELRSPSGVLTRDRSSQEVWQVPGASPVVSRTSEESLLPRLATWEKSEGIASRILLNIECQMHRCPFTLGLGEPNLAGKPNLEYDLVVRPSDLHSIKKPSSPPSIRNLENETLFTIHQILESWLFVARELLKRIVVRLDGKEWEKAASDCWILEQIWKLLSRVEDLHLLMDPDDFLHLKNQLAIQATPGSSEALCFRSAALLELTRLSNDLKRRVPFILGVEVDPKGGPRVQDAAMILFHKQSRDDGAVSRVHLLQAFQAIEGAMKSFFFAYRQLTVTVMGSLEATGESLAHRFLEPPYFPSLDAAKTFLGEFWRRERGGGAGGAATAFTVNTSASASK